MNLYDLEIDAGKLRQRVALETLTETADSYGQLQKSWATQNTYWAWIKPLAGRELVNAQQIKATVSHAIVTRFNRDIAVDPTLRLTMGSRIFNVEAVLDIEERQKKTLILATEQPQPVET